jgi:hypothetical protein
MRLIGIALFIFWFSMMGLLVYQELIQPRSFVFSPNRGRMAEHFFKLPFRQEWMGIYYRDKKVGFSYTTVSPQILGEEEGYNITNKTKLYLAMAGEEYNLSLDGFSFVDSSYRLKKFELKVSSGEYSIRIEGECLKDKLRLLLNSSGETFRKEIDIREEALVANTLTPFYVLPSLYPGKRFTVSIIDPLTLSLGKAEVIVGAEEDYLFQGKICKVMPVEVKYQGISSHALITEEGEILREETPLGWVMVREDRAESLRWAGERKEKVDLAYAVAIPVKREIPAPEKIRELRLKINGIDLDNFSDGRQEVLDKEKRIVIIRRESPEITQEIKGYIEGDAFIQVDNRDIKELAREIAGDEPDPWLRVKKLNNWVYKNIKKQPTLSIPSAVEVLKTRQGDCNEHTILFTALSRSLGISTKVCVGLVYLKGYFFYHAWPEVFVGKWIAIDPTLGEEIANATHIKLAEGGIESQIDIAKLIGNIDIEVLGYE